jgi:hypothetical protein
VVPDVWRENEHVTLLTTWPHFVYHDRKKERSKTMGREYNEV